MIKVLIVDDHPIVRHGLKQILAEESDMSGGEAENGNDALALVRRENFDLVVLDINLPDISGLEVLKQLKKARPKLPVLVLSMYPEEQFAVQALKGGAAGYITKKSAPEELVKAIRKVLTGGRYISPSLAEKLAFDLQTGEKPRHETLSNREFQVMCMIASGKTVKQIADELFLSVETVSTYRARILDKMNMKTNAKLTHYVIRNGLIE